MGDLVNLFKQGDDPAANEALEASAMTLLHREVVRNGQVVLTKADFEAYEVDRETLLKGFAFKTNEQGDIIIEHVLDLTRQDQP